MTQPEFDFNKKAKDEVGKILRDDGIKRAVDHADRVDPGWQDKAYKFLIERYLPQKNGPFMTEDVRSFAAYWDIDPPPDNRAWGHVIVKAVKAGILKKAGTGTTENPISHKRPANFWIQVKPSERK